MKTKPKIKIKKQDTRYVLSDGKYTISAIISEDNTFSIYRQKYFNEDFQFHKSTPETIGAVARLLLEAIRLNKKNEKRV